MLIKKRDGSYREFDQSKIARAMLAAFHAHQPDNIPDISSMMFRVVNNCKDRMSVEEVQDLVENALMDAGHHDVARAYIKYRQHRTESRGLRPDASALSDYITVAKYARYEPELGRRETFPEIVGRVASMHQDRWPEHEREIEEVFSRVHDKEVLPSMRSMQFGGIAIEQNQCRMYNCAFTHMNRLRAFGEIFWALLSGTGVGFSVQFRHVDQLAPVKRIDKRNVRHHTVEDTIEGWGDAVTELVRSHFVLGCHIEFDYSQIRPEGSELKVSGGKAPGHLPLRRCLERLRALFTKCAGRKMRPIEVFDAVCFLAEAVLAGGIRRSSLICIFSIDDFEMMTAKAHGNFVPEGIPGKEPENAQRAMANISAFCDRNTITREQFDRLMSFSHEWGEPGFYFGLHPDWGTNPCGEIGLDPVLRDYYRDNEGRGAVEVVDRTLDYDWKDYAQTKWDGDRLMTVVPHGPTSDLEEVDPVQVYGSNVGFQFCNLCEINGAAVQDYDHFMSLAEAAAQIGTMQAAYNEFPYLGPVTEAVVRRDALLGVGLTGIMDNPDFTLNPQYLRDAANVVTSTNRAWAKKLGINAAPRTTTVKPGGTAPLVLGCVGSGSTPHHAEKYFRRVTANPHEPPAQHFAKTNPHMIEVKPNGDWCITFCVEAPDSAITVQNLTAVEHMDMIFNLYENWVRPGSSGGSLTHNVSCTVVVDEPDWLGVVDHVWENRHRITAMSFLPRIGDKVFPFAPREAIANAVDQAKWDAICRSYKPVDWTAFREDSDNTDLAREIACGGGACEL